MIKKQIFTFLLRWAGASIGMYLCLNWFGTINAEAYEGFAEPWMLFVVAGLIFSLVNSIIKPVIKLLALPLAILTMGLSTVIINTAMVLLTIYLLPGVEMEIWPAVISSVVMSLMNTVINIIVS